MIAIVDYGMGNLRSVEKAFHAVGYDAEITSSPQRVREADGVVLPGVGAFGEAMANLARAGLVDVLRQVSADRPFLGICLGQQLLFEESVEMGRFEGLGILSGVVERFSGPEKVPHIGWNQLHMVRPSPILTGVHDGDFAYFVHSYYVAPSDPDVILATTDYGVAFASIVGRDSLFGLQFHPEKSQAVGLTMLANFGAMVKQS
jgi:imidazole glycerol-phosphate synthase subunit HisH